MDKWHKWPVEVPPEDCEYYWITFDEPDVRECVDMALINNGEWFLLDNITTNANIQVAAWMEIDWPEPYKGA
jgi:hypothetical protein